jgi:hypothetical protein
MFEHCPIDGQFGRERLQALEGQTGNVEISLRVSGGGGESSD